MNIERANRFKNFFRRNAAYYNNYCFQLFLWYPLPDGTWEILFGREDPNEYHERLWSSEGIRKLAEAWEIPVDLIPSSIGENAIPTGYVDFTEERGREYMVLIVPDPMPEGWTVSRLSKSLKCGNEIKRVKESERRGSKPSELRKLLETLEELRLQPWGR